MGKYTEVVCWKGKERHSDGQKREREVINLQEIAVVSKYLILIKIQ